MITRRKFLTSAGALAGSATVLQKLAWAQEIKTREPNKPGETTAAANKNKPLIERVDPKPTLPPGEPGKDYTPVITPNNTALPWKIIGGVKVYHLVAEEVNHEFAPGMKVKLWGFNGRVHGPTIEAVEGDRVRIYVTNNLPEATSVHWHGILLPNGMDGVAGLNQKAIQPGETFRYEFTLRQHGTHMYHSHSDEMTQMALGAMGLFIIHPRRPRDQRPDRDFAFMLGEWRLDTGTYRPNPNEMTDFNVFTFNAKIFPATEPMVAKLGERVRIRLASVAAMSHHPIHLHGHSFRITETDGGQIPESAQQVETTVLVAIGQSRTFDFVADQPGDWAMHCHMTHHVMTQMGDKFPNTIGVSKHNRRASRETGPEDPRQLAARLHDNGNERHGRDGRDAHEGAAQQPSDGWSVWPIRCDRHERAADFAQSSRRDHKLRRSGLVSASGRDCRDGCERRSTFARRHRCRSFTDETESRKASTLRLVAA